VPPFLANDRDQALPEGPQIDRPAEPMLFTRPRARRCASDYAAVLEGVQRPNALEYGHFAPGADLWSTLP
jgi:hypothetical protein